MLRARMLDLLDVLDEAALSDPKRKPRMPSAMRKEMKTTGAPAHVHARIRTLQRERGTAMRLAKKAKDMAPSEVKGFEAGAKKHAVKHFVKKARAAHDELKAHTAQAGERLAAKQKLARRGRIAKVRDWVKGKLAKK
jgi:hypothetical protein